MPHPCYASYQAIGIGAVAIFELALTIRQGDGLLFSDFMGGDPSLRLKSGSARDDAKSEHSGIQAELQPAIGYT